MDDAEERQAFPRFQIPERFVEKHRYRPLTPEVKGQIFSGNAARLFHLDLEAKRNEVPKDFAGRMRMAYLEEGSSPSHRFYG